MSIRNDDLWFRSLYPEGNRAGSEESKESYEKIVKNPAFLPEELPFEESLSLLFLARRHPDSAAEFTRDIAPKLPEAYKITPLTDILERTLPDESVEAITEIEDLYTEYPRKAIAPIRYAEDRQIGFYSDPNTFPYLRILYLNTAHEPSLEQALARSPHLRSLRVLKLQAPEKITQLTLQALASLPSCEIIRIANLPISHIAAQPACTVFSLENSSENTSFGDFPSCKTFSLINCPKIRFYPEFCYCSLLNEACTHRTIVNCPKIAENDDPENIALNHPTSALSLGPIEWVLDEGGSSRGDAIWEYLGIQKGSDPDSPAYVFRLKEENNDALFFRLFGLSSHRNETDKKNNLRKKLVRQTPAVSWPTEDIPTSMKEFLTPGFARLGYRLYPKDSPDGNHAVYMSVPSVPLLEQRWNKLRENYPSFRDIDLRITISKGIASDREFIEAYQEYDLLISEGEECMHDHIIHARTVFGEIFHSSKEDRKKRFDLFRENKKKAIQIGLSLIEDPENKEIQKQLLFGVSFFIDTLHAKNVVSGFRDGPLFDDSDRYRTFIEKAYYNLRKHLNKSDSFDAERKGDNPFFTLLEEAASSWKKLREQAEKS